MVAPGASHSVPAPGFTKDKNIVFAPHIYAESLSGSRIGSGFAQAIGVGQAYGVPVWSGEWGFFPENPQDAADKIERYAAAEDQYEIGGAWWSWKQACGDPHVVPRPGAEPNPSTGNLNRFTCPDEVMTKTGPVFGDVLSRPVPRAVPGRITKLTSDGRTGVFDLSGKLTRDAERCSLRVFVPERFADKRVRVEGIRNLQTRERRGNVLLRGCVSDRFRLRIG